jgi:hypothetical protein
MKRVVLGWILPAVLVGSCLFVGKGSHGEIVYHPTSKQEQSFTLPAARGAEAEAVPRLC